MLKQLALATFAATAFVATLSLRSPMRLGLCGSNGTQVSGLSVQGASGQISGVILPSGEIVALP